MAVSTAFAREGTCAGDKVCFNRDCSMFYQARLLAALVRVAKPSPHCYSKPHLPISCCAKFDPQQTVVRTSGATKDVILTNSNFCLRMISIVLLRNVGNALRLPGGYKNTSLAVLDLFSQMLVVWAACFQRSEADSCEKVESYL